MPNADAGNLLLLEKYYRDEAEGMMSFAAYILKDPSLAEVAVQETFLAALSNMDKFARSPKPVGWLYAALKNIIKHIQRDQRKQLKRFVSMDDLGDGKLVTDDRNTIDLILTSASCTDSDMKLLYEFYAEGYSLKELSEKYNISVGACKMRIRRAKDHAKT